MQRLGDQKVIKDKGMLIRKQLNEMKWNGNHKVTKGKCIVIIKWSKKMKWLSESDQREMYDY
jgi:hypothetical protein